MESDIAQLNFNRRHHVEVYFWDTSLIDDLPEHTKIAFQFFSNRANELSVEVINKKARDMTAILKDCLCRSAYIVYSDIHIDMYILLRQAY